MTVELTVFCQLRFQGRDLPPGLPDSMRLWPLPVAGDHLFLDVVVDPRYSALGAEAVTHRFKVQRREFRIQSSVPAPGGSMPTPYQTEHTLYLDHVVEPVDA